jgi:RimK family alpha-L-glutamate ligase
MRIAVLCSPESWYLRDLQRAAGDRHELVQVRYSQLTAEICEDTFRVSCDGVVLNDFDAVLVRTMPPGSLEQVVFRMDALAHLEAAGTLVLNPPKAIEAAVDKYLALARLQAIGVPTPRTIVCQTADEAMIAFESLGECAVVKPLFGGEGRGIARLDDEAMALRAFSMLEQLGAVIYLQEYIEHPGYDTRVLLIGNDVFGMRRSSLDDWRTNISRGGHAESVELDEPTIDLARQSATAIGAPLAGVDIIQSPDGSPKVLEVNAVPGWQRLARTLDVDIAQLVLEYTEQQIICRHALASGFVLRN